MTSRVVCKMEALYPVFSWNRTLMNSSGWMAMASMIPANPPAYVRVVGEADDDIGVCVGVVETVGAF